jgi:flagellar hook-length control protein FliK
MLVAYAWVIQLYGLAMEILTLPIQLSAQAASSEIAADILASRLGLDGSDDIFAALLSRQLGATLNARPETIPAAVDIVQKALPDVLDEDDVVIDSQAAQELASGMVAIATSFSGVAVPLPPVTLPNFIGVEGGAPASVGKSQFKVGDVPIMASDAPVEVGKRQAVAVAAAGFAENVADGTALEKPELPPVAAVLKSLARNAEPAVVRDVLDSAPAGSASHSFVVESSPLAMAGNGQSAGGVSSQVLQLQFHMSPSQHATQIVSSQVAGAIAHPVASSVWGEALGERVVWMAGQQQQGAELHLNPPSLGPLEVKLSMNDGQASLTFSTQHQPVREAIEAATPRLREMLSESGISLGSVSVNVGSFSQQQPGAQAQQGGNGQQRWVEAVAPSDLVPAVPSAVTILSGHQGMVDIFA